MPDVNRYFPVLNRDANNVQMGWSLVDYGKIAIVITAPLVAPQLETLVQTEDLTAFYLDYELKSFATRRPIRG